MPSKPQTKKANSRPKRVQVDWVEVTAMDRRCIAGKAGTEFTDDQLAGLHWFALFPLLKEHQDKFGKAGWMHWNEAIWDDSNQLIGAFWEAYAGSPDKALKVVQAFRNLNAEHALGFELADGKVIGVIDKGSTLKFSDAVRMAFLKEVKPELCIAAQQDADVASLMNRGDTAEAAESTGRMIRRYIAKNRRKPPE